MDVTLTRTFVDVAETGSFIGAANRLNITQSTVSTRIKTLEEHLGQRLFVRNKSGTTLTPAGQEFNRYASTLIHNWEQARHHVALPTGYDGVLSIGAQVSFWDSYLFDWLGWMNIQYPNISIEAKYGLPERLMTKLVEGALNIGIMYVPQNRPNLKIEILFAETLCLVTANVDDPDVTPESYILVDWGPEFRREHSLRLPTLSNPGITFNLGSIGLQFILSNGKAAYFPTRLTEKYEAEGRLKRCEWAPTFSLNAYAVYAQDENNIHTATAIEGLHKIAKTF